MIHAIVAYDLNRCIGKGGKLPWHYKEDLDFFKKTTMGHTIVMGGETFRSLPKVLPNRKHLVLSRTLNTLRQDIQVWTSAYQLGDWIEAHVNSPVQLFLIGGEAIFQNYLHLATSVYVTEMAQVCNGDRFFPLLNKDNNWKVKKISFTRNYRRFHFTCE